MGALLVALLGLFLLSLSQTTPASVGRPSGPPTLHFETSEVTLGRLRPGRERVVSVGWRRTGAGTLRVLQARTDCGCALLDALPTHVPETYHGRLRVRLTAPSKPGPLRHRVRIVTDGPPGHDVHDVWISGHVDADIAVRPTALDVPPGPGGTEVTAVLQLTWDRSTQGVEVSPRARLIGLEGHVQVAPASRPGADGAQLIVTLRRPPDPGRMDGWVEVDLGRRGPLAVRVRGTVHPTRPDALAGLDR